MIRPAILLLALACGGCATSAPSGGGEFETYMDEFSANLRNQPPPQLATPAPVAPIPMPRYQNCTTTTAPSGQITTNC
jgi:hypothetical protein